ncbi:hypothetical protein NADFUDRAFT_79527 [Nadsonia fulvescens var. elongata DSM 6958]|uniref:DUF1753-domain-containing protein n=1 Tax=Nadsonia fulvescens var. elongata DSM 6958 TaxID=857566 RepID=A0A1E3PGU6_9ASCO|nr:hypothetical protein NADFUDRAFT_79527 [Nadsonia fulvescens var. elongata DSM 6958]
MSTFSRLFLSMAPSAHALPYIVTLILTFTLFNKVSSFYTLLSLGTLDSPVWQLIVAFISFLTIPIFILGLQASSSELSAETLLQNPVPRGRDAEEKVIPTILATALVYTIDTFIALFTYLFFGSIWKHEVANASTAQKQSSRDSEPASDGTKTPDYTDSATPGQETAAAIIVTIFLYIVRIYFCIALLNLASKLRKFFRGSVGEPNRGYLGWREKSLYLWDKLFKEDINLN